MSKDNGRYHASEMEERREKAVPSGDNYDEMLLLEDLESLREQMDELGVDSREQALRWLDPPAADQEMGVPPAADRAVLQAIVQLMDELDVLDRRDLDRRIHQMQENMSWD